MTSHNPAPDPALVATLRRIRGKTDVIVRQQASADAGRFTGMGAAIGLQQVRRERQLLQSTLPPLRLV